MARTIDAKVIEILGPNYNSKTRPSLARFIDTAASLVNWVVTQDVDGLMNSDSLELVERWLAAHFYAHSDQLYQSKNTSGAGATFQGQTAMILKSTQYGQTAMLLDVTNSLAMRSKNAENGTLPIVTLQTLDLDSGAIYPSDQYGY